MMDNTGLSPNKIILGIDTSQQSLSLAVASNTLLLSSVIDNSGLPHSQRLFPLLAETLDSLKLTIHDIDFFLINTGPGSFTGLRVGIAAVKGLAATLGKRLLGMTAFDVIALSLPASSFPLVILLNASRGELFCGMRKWTSAVELQKIGPDCVISVNHLKENITTQLGDKDAIFIGNGAFAHWADLGANKRWQLAETPASLAAAMAMAGGVGKRFPQVLTGQVEATYLRPSEAEIKLAK
jgi:tRNA threonylcarbamoyladenosine biosynthesis protein TsaB